MVVELAFCELSGCNRDFMWELSLGVLPCGGLRHSVAKLFGKPPWDGKCDALRIPMVSAMCVSRLPIVSAMHVSRLPMVSAIRVWESTHVVEAAFGKCDACVEASVGKCDAFFEAAVGNCDVSRLPFRRWHNINLVDPASSHMLVSKIKPCMSQYKLLHGETANGSLKQLSFIWWSFITWITMVILELIHAPRPDFVEGLCLLGTEPT